MHSFTSACYSFKHNRNITSGDISVKMSPVVTFSHRRHFSLFCFAIINAKPTLRSSLLSQSSWHIHSHMHSFTSACYSFNHIRNINNEVTFQYKCHQSWHFHTEGISAFLLCKNQCGIRYSDHPSISIQLTQLIHTWIHSLQRCYSFNHKRNITSGDISVKMSPCRNIFTQKAFPAGSALQ